MKPKVAILFDNFGPYHVARLEAAAKRLRLLAIEQRAKSAEYQWGATSDTSFARITLLEGGAAPVNSRVERALVRKALDDFQPEVIAVPGWVSRQARAGLTWSLEHEVPVVVMSDSQESDFPRSRWKEWIKARNVRLCAAGLVGGTPHRAYLSKLGMASKRIQTGYDVVDNAYFAGSADQVRKNYGGVLEELGIRRPFFLCSARFIEKKNLPLLIEAFARYRDREIAHGRADTGWDLVLLGDGPLRGTLKAMAKKRGLSNNIHLPGFVQYDGLPKYYGTASCFVLASTAEQWGLVVNEAMASGLPVLVSERCGCAPDLVENGKNGFTFDPYDVDALAGLMERVAGADCDRAAMSAASLEIIDHWSPETFASGLEAAVQAALKGGGRNPGWLDWTLLRALSHR